MSFVSSTTELTTAATDLLLALIAMGAVYFLLKKMKVTTRSVYWLVILSCLVIAAFLGAVAHGLEISAPFKETLWMMIYFSLAILVAMFVVVVSFDVFGASIARRILLPMIATALGFLFYVTQIAASFLPFIIYEITAMLLALVGYVWLWRRGVSGACWLSCGVMLTIVAAAIQATQALSFTLIWPFDHNSVYHLLQIVALIMLLRGLVVSSEVSGEVQS